MAPGAGRSERQGDRPGETPGTRGAEAAELSSRTEEGWQVLALSGDWTTSSVAAADRPLRSAALRVSGKVRIDLGEVRRLDTAGAWLVQRTRGDLEGAGNKVELAGGSDDQQALLERVAQTEIGGPPEVGDSNPLARVLIHLGRSTYEFGAEARDLLNFLGYAVIVLARTLVNPRRLRFVALVNLMEKTGLDAMPIVGLISFLIGVVLAYQGSDQLARFGAQIFTVNLVGIGVLREMGIILTAIIIAGRSGSAFTAQIGTMKVNEEIDAMQTIGLDPMDVLVMPRVIALMLVLPLLTFYADLMGIFGGAVMAHFVLDISFESFLRQLQEAVPLWSFWVGIIKAPIFAFIIALVGCFEGLKVGGSSESVGLQTTKSVVEAIFIVIVLDAIFSILFSYIGI